MKYMVEKGKMVQNAGFALKNRQNGRRKNLEIVAFCPLFNQHSR